MMKVRTGMNDKIVVCLGKGGRDMAESFARRTGARYRISREII